jgi:hypothetical protein
MTSSPVLPDTGVPVPLSGMFTSVLDGGLAHDILVDGVPFRLLPSEEFPYIREIRADQKDQFDSSTEAGEQSFGRWWLRSQSSFHGGSGQTYLDSGEPAQGRLRFATSRYAYPFEPGQCTIAGAFSLSNLGRTRVEQVTWSATQKLAMMSSANHQVQVVDLPGMGGATTISCGASGVCQDMTSDGVNLYVAVNDRVYRINSAGVATEISSIVFSGLVTLGYAKQRLILCLGNKVYDVDSAAVVTTPPVLKYTHPNTGWSYTCVAEGPNGIYLVGSAGPFSDVSSMAITDSGSGITLGTPIVQMLAPKGETFHSVLFYTNSMFVLSTSNGIRAGIFTPYGQPQYGALMQPGNPTYGLSASGSLVYVGGLDSVWWVDLGTQLDSAGRFASALYADTLNVADATDTVLDLTVYPSAGRDLVFGALDSGNVLTQTSYAPTQAATLTTSWVRFDTVEPKQLAYLRLEGEFPEVGGVTNVASVVVETSEGDTATFNMEGGSNSYEFGLFSLPPAQSVRLTFTLRDAGAGNGVMLRSWQIKALPAPRQYREIVLPLACYDREKDYRGKEHGHAGFAWERVQALEVLAEENAVVTVVDRLVGVTYQAQVRRAQFVQTVSPTTDGRIGGRVNLVLWQV